MTELETLNMLLRLAGSSPVNSLESDHPDVANATTTMNRIRQRAQKRGWWYNIDYGVIFYPDEAGFIKIPTTVTTIQFSDSNLVMRGRRLYDKEANSYMFTAQQECLKLIKNLEWDDMPESMQEYCAYYAATEYIRDELEDPTKEQSLKESAGMARLDLQKEDLAMGQYNVFNTQRIASARGGIRPYNRNSGRFYGTPDR